MPSLYARRYAGFKLFQYLNGSLWMSNVFQSAGQSTICLFRGDPIVIRPLTLLTHSFSFFSVPRAFKRPIKETRRQGSGFRSPISLLSAKRSSGHDQNAPDHKNRDDQRGTEAAEVEAAVRNRFGQKVADSRSERACKDEGRPEQ
jgi:hypothetical protein